MKDFRDLIKYVVAVWVAYPFASVLSYFSPASQKTSWIESLYVSCFLTVLLIVIYCFKRHKISKITTKIDFYDLVERLNVGEIELEIKYQQYTICILKKDNSYTCEILVKDKLKKISNFHSKESLLISEILWNKSLHEIIDGSKSIEVISKHTRDSSETGDGSLSHRFHQL